jgi:DNA-binding CsgD family transcriptional regulator
MSTQLHPDRLLAAVERTCATAATSDELLEGLSADLHRAIPHDGSSWFGLDPATMLATAPSRVESLDSAMCAPFWHLEFHEHDAGLYADLARGDGVYAMRLQLGDRPAKSARYREFMVPQGYDDELRAVFRAGDCAWGFVGLYRDSSAHPFTEAEVDAVQVITGVVAVALRAHIRDVAPMSGPPTAPGLLVVGRDDRILSSNDEATQWMAQLFPREPSADGGDREAVANAFLVDATTPLYALVARARAVAAARERVPARLRLRDRRGRWVVLHASVLRADGDDGPGDVAVVIEAAKSAEIAPILIDAYSLTPRERDVLGAIARGGTTSEIAAELHLSPHTVRDYVKTVFEKFGVSSRGELVARLFGEHYADPMHATMIHA